MSEFKLTRDYDQVRWWPTLDLGLLRGFFGSFLIIFMVIITGGGYWGLLLMPFMLAILYFIAALTALALSSLPGPLGTIFKVLGLIFILPVILVGDPLLNVANAIAKGKLVPTKDFRLFNFRLVVFVLKEYPLISAAENGDVQGIRTLLETGAPVDQTGYFDNTALMAAARGAHLDAVDLLIKGGADVNKKSKTGATPIIWANSPDQDDTRAEIIKLLHQAGADLNYADSDHNTALLGAVSNGNIKCVAALLELGAKADSSLLESLPRHKSSTVHDTVEIMIKQAMEV